MRGGLAWFLGSAMLFTSASIHGIAATVLLALALLWYCGAGYAAADELCGGVIHERVLRKITHRPLPKGEPLYARRKASERTIKALERELKPGTYAHGECTVLHRSEQAMLRCRNA